MIIVSKKGPVFVVEHMIYVIACLISPYMYAWFAVFGAAEEGSTVFYFAIGIELFFLLNIIFSFFVEFEVEGKVLPVRDLGKIAENYLKGHFMFDFLPVIPFQFLDL